MQHRSEREQGVYLAIFEILEAERTILDRLEGLGSGYNSTDLDVDGFGTCASYVADRGAIDEFLPPLDWYKEMVFLGGVANQFPEFYIRDIEAVATTVDSNKKRAREQWKIVEELRLTI